MLQNSKKHLKRYLLRPEEALFVDIETEGLSRERNDITLIGIYKKDRYFAFVKGINLEKALRFLATTPLWITFGGENFDIPFLKKTFQGLSYPEIHLDLYHLTGAIGLKGGLKKIEKALGLERQTDGMNGYDAVKLWKKWVEDRDKSALRKLILYNREDVVNLKIILEHVIRKFFFEERRKR